jgi:hypothetical protein
MLARCFALDNRSTTDVERLQTSLTSRSSSASAFDLCRLRAAATIASSNLLGPKRVATRDLSGFQAGHEPTGALRRSTVGKSVRHDVALSSPLQSIVSDGCGSLQGCFYITT